MHQFDDDCVRLADVDLDAPARCERGDAPNHDMRERTKPCTFRPPPIATWRRRGGAEIHQRRLGTQAVSAQDGDVVAGSVPSRPTEASSV